MLGDEDRPVLALSSLTINALEYTPAGGRVIVSAARIGEQIHISVSDTGLGITPEHLPRIFDWFCRADASRSRQAGGSGIGLTIEPAPIEAHGRRIWAASTGEGKGSVFTFSVPPAT